MNVVTRSPDEVAAEELAGIVVRVYGNMTQPQGARMLALLIDAYAGRAEPYEQHVREALLRAVDRGDVMFRAAVREELERWERT